MTRSRLLMLLWLGLGVLTWNATFDLWMTSETRQYLLREAMWELGRGPQPVLTEAMAQASRSGAVRASMWTVVVVSAGLLTLRLRK
ncbi:MAG: hypothetical protein ABIP90_07220 [Vicinamibacterales bacterium]